MPSAGESPNAANVPVLDKTALDRWVEQFGTRDDMANEYQRLLRTEGPNWHGWAALNLAIMDRWSMAGLRWIENRAWRLAGV